MRDIAPAVHAGQWIEFFDDGGRGLAQPDYFIECETHILLIECKLTQTSVAFAQMNDLYVPLLHHIYSRPVTALLACRVLRFSPGAEAHPRDLLSSPRFDNPTWHHPLRSST